ncbi:hypothetical protein G9A89_002173 [Geosiphon pyriformis]|nr:hypothetical protein G9A89_002173 [Geosiphon pyriformis]
MLIPPARQKQLVVRYPTGTIKPRTNAFKILPSTQSSSATCKEGELVVAEENAGTKKRKRRQQQSMANPQKTKDPQPHIINQDVSHPLKAAIEAMDELGEICL